MTILVPINPQVTWIAAAGSDPVGLFDDFEQETVAGRSFDVKSRNADRHVEKNLASFTFDERCIGDMPMANLTAGHVLESQCRNQHLQVGRRSEIVVKIGKEAVMAPLETTEPHGAEIPQFNELVERHLRVEDAHIGQILF